jgi:predicted metal-dependent hydrolase
MDGRDLPYKVERRDVRYPRLEFKTGELLAILPKSWKDETPLLERKMNWISKKHEEIQNAIENVKNQRKNARDLPVLGDFFKVNEDGSLKIDFDKKQIECNLRDRNQLRRLAIILKKKLLYEIEQAAEEYSKKFGVEFNKIFIRRQKTKWASCSSKGNLSFNFWLICLPRELVRYVVCHEVLHLKEKRHDKTFREEMAREFENYKQLEKSLFEYWFFVQEYPRSTFLADFVG